MWLNSQTCKARSYQKYFYVFNGHHCTYEMLPVKAAGVDLAKIRQLPRNTA
jgi:hypothetical protein